VFRERPPRHLRHDGELLLAKYRVMVEFEHAEIGVPLQDLRRSVHGAVVRRDDEIGALCQMVLDHQGDDVDFVTHHDGDDELHRSCSNVPGPRRSWSRGWDTRPPAIALPGRSGLWRISRRRA